MNTPTRRRGPRNKWIYNPLLQPGFHVRTLEEIETLCVSDHPYGTSNRVKVWDGFCRFLSILQEIPIGIEMWVDGSFSTEKPDPEDVDVVCFAKADSIDSLSKYEKKLNYLFAKNNLKQTKHRFHTDARLIPEFPALDSRKYWVQTFGSDDEGVPKGIIQLHLPDNDYEFHHK